MKNPNPSRYLTNAAKKYPRYAIMCDHGTDWAYTRADAEQRLREVIKRHPDAYIADTKLN